MYYIEKSWSAMDSLYIGTNLYPTCKVATLSDKWYCLIMNRLLLWDRIVYARRTNIDINSLHCYSVEGQYIYIYVSHLQCMVHFLILFYFLAVWTSIVSLMVLKLVLEDDITYNVQSFMLPPHNGTTGILSWYFLFLLCSFCKCYANVEEKLIIQQVISSPHLVILFLYVHL